MHIRDGLRNIRANRLRAGLTVVIIAAGMMCLVGMLVTTEGMKYLVNDRFSGMDANNIIIQSVMQSTLTGKKHRMSEKRLHYDEAKKFTQHYPRRHGVTSIILGGSHSFKVQRKGIESLNDVPLEGIDENYFLVKDAPLLRGRGFTRREVLLGASVIILGQPQYEELFDPAETVIGARVKILKKTFVVVGVLAAEDDSKMLIPTKTHPKIQRIANAFVVIKSTLVTSEHALLEAERLMKIIRGDGKKRKRPSFEILRNDALQEKNNTAIRSIRWAGLSIAGITLLGTCVALLNIMLVYVKERVNEIGLRKALGASPKRILTQFLVETMCICQLGGGVGIVLGLMAGRVVGMLMKTPFFIPWEAVGVGIVTSSLVGILSGYLPAKRAASVDPVDSLRSE